MSILSDHDEKYNFPKLQELQWSGLSQGSLFERPSANVLVAVESVDGSEVQPSFNSQRQYTVTNVSSHLLLK